MVNCFSPLSVTVYLAVSDAVQQDVPALVDVHQWFADDDRLVTEAVLHEVVTCLVETSHVQVFGVDVIVEQLRTTNARLRHVQQGTLKTQRTRSVKSLSEAYICRAHIVWHPMKITFTDTL